MRVHIVLPALAAVILSLALGVDAQAPLIGIWEHGGADGTTRLHLFEDGSAAVEARAIVGLRDPADELTQAFPEFITVEVEAHGTWRAEGARLFFTLPERQLRIDGESFDDAMTTLATLVATATVEAQGLPPEAIPNLVGFVVIGLKAEYDEQSLLDEAMGDLTAGQPYRIEGDTLWLADGDGVETSWRRVVSSVVARGTWAQAKRRGATVGGRAAP